MDETRVPLYQRLPEIYRIKDEEQNPPYQLKNYLALVEDAFSAIHENIENLYSDLFIETCDDWVIPYIGDLLGVSHLKGDPWTLRADVADTIALRRRKGTKAGIERLTFNLSKWGVHCVELRENLVWNQQLNHQRPDAGGNPPYAAIKCFSPIRGGTVTLRDPAVLSLLGTPFDSFGHIADLKPPSFGSVRYNLPNLAIFLWRLKDYRVIASKPLFSKIKKTRTTIPDKEATHVVRFEVHPLGYPVKLFNTYQFDPDREPPIVTELNRTPGPIPRARLSENTESGNPEAYLAINSYDPQNISTELEVADIGLQLHLPKSKFKDEVWPNKQEESSWLVRGANLCAWEKGVRPALKNREAVIDPEVGRILVGVGSYSEAKALKKHLLLTYTYGAVGPVGAHPISRDDAPKEWQGEKVIFKEVNFHSDRNSLRNALNDLDQGISPIVITIQDSMVHMLDLTAVRGVFTEDNKPNLKLSKTLVIRAADGKRPIVKLKQPLRFRPTNVHSTLPEEQKQFDVAMDKLTVRLEGIYLTRDKSFSPAKGPLIARAALNSLEIINCTLDPSEYKKFSGTRTAIHTSMELSYPYGFTDKNEEKAFKQTPEIILQRTIAGPLKIDERYRLFLTSSILDAGKGVSDAPEDSFGVTGAGNPSNSWGPPTEVNGLTVFGRMRVNSINGRGGIWVHALEVLNNQKGCIKFSYFSGVGDRLPQNLGCIEGMDSTQKIVARLHFTSEIFGEAAYGQLAHSSDFRIRERGPNDDAMGAFGFLLEAHKWRNLQIRYGEFMPVGVRPLLVPVT